MTSSKNTFIVQFFKSIPIKRPTGDFDDVIKIYKLNNFAKFCKKKLLQLGYPLKDTHKNTYR